LDTVGLKEKIRDYKQEIEHADTLLSQYFANDLNLFPFKTTSPAKQLLEPASFARISLKEKQLSLLQIIAQITMLEYKGIAFCDEQVPYYRPYYDSYSAIVGQSSNCVVPGEKMEVIAGVGAFSRKAEPRIRINDSLIPINAEGVANYQFTAPKRKGQHTIPVQINFIDQHGKIQTMNKDVVFTVGGSK
jgi:hypothetical protein